MGLVNLISPPPGPAGWEEFWFNNWIDHELIHSNIQTDKSDNTTIYVIIPWHEADASDLLEKHQLYHDDMNGVLGLNGQDLSQVNLKDEQAVKAWVWQHYQEHQAVHQALGI